MRMRGERGRVRKTDSRRNMQKATWEGEKNIRKEFISFVRVNSYDEGYKLLCHKENFLKF